MEPVFANEDIQYIQPRLIFVFLGFFRDIQKRGKGYPLGILPTKLKNSWVNCQQKNMPKYPSFVTVISPALWFFSWNLWSNYIGFLCNKNGEFRSLILVMETWKWPTGNHDQMTLAAVGFRHWTKNRSHRKTVKPYVSRHEFSPIPNHSQKLP